MTILTVCRSIAIVLQTHLCLTRHPALLEERAGLQVAAEQQIKLQTINHLTCFLTCSLLNAVRRLISMSLFSFFPSSKLVRYYCFFTDDGFGAYTVGFA